MGSETVVPRIPVVELSSEKLKGGSDSWDSACQEEIKTKNLDPKVYTPKTSFVPQHLRLDKATDKEQWQNITNLLWPHGNQHFCETVYTYALLLAEMQELLVKMLCDSYNIEKGYSESHIKSTTYAMGLFKYERANQTDAKLSLRGHRDMSFLSILHQNQTKGLEIRIEDGEKHEWVFYEPSSPSSFIVFAADTCMGWSNNRVKSCYHRVVVEGGEVRYSVGIFAYLTGLIKVPKELVDENHPLKYKPFESQPFIDSYLTSNDPDKYDRNNLKVYCGI
ncbi:2-oxoglutarate (2OG) and Fe(II)-dependent oxygenase superfamily protein [Euphorbia peplus]|nr:2-oxoglutarate (2OG) and Fe(II)-dependent oxygenase superfamily protein [Euphorbia peplus]